MHRQARRGTPWPQRMFARSSGQHLEKALLGLGCLAIVVGAAWALRVPAPLGHDESVYAVMARHWLGGGPDTGVSLHRAPLLPALGLPVLWAGGGDTALQAFGTLAALGSAAALWWLARMVQGPVAGLLAVGVFVTAPTVFHATTRFLTDLPATALLLALVALLWWQFADRPVPDRWLLLAAPLAWGAYELRYGSALPVILVFATTIVLFWPMVRRYWRLGVWTIALLLVLLLPHLVNSTLEFGAPWERVVRTSAMVGSDHFGQGLGQYVRWFPAQLAGPVAAALMAVGLVGSVVVAIGRLVPGPARFDHDLRRGLAFLTLPALAHVLGIGLTSRGEPRFVFFAVALLCAAGACVTVAALRWTAGRAPGVAALIVIAAVVGVYASTVPPTEAGDRAAMIERYEVMREVSRFLREQGGDDCSVRTSYAPQITWYTGCPSYAFGETPERGDASAPPRWLLLFEDGKSQPSSDELEELRSTYQQVRSFDASRDGLFGSAVLYRAAGRD